MKAIKILTVIFFTAVFIVINAQTVNKTTVSLKYTDILASSGDSLLETDQTAKYLNYDFSGILKPHRVLGIIGDNYQRLQMKFLRIEKNENNPAEYIVFGQSKVNNNICDYKGKIVVEKIQETIRFRHGLDNMYKGKYLVSGMLTAKYTLHEDSTQNNAGLFAGTLHSLWYIDSENNLRYDDMFSFSDRYYNNAYVGTWQSYETCKKKICNFGEYRIPFTKSDFDIGSGEFYPNPKYKNTGWQNTVLRKKNGEKELNNKHKINAPAKDIRIDPALQFSSFYTRDHRQCVGPDF